MKKVISIVLALAMVLSLTACGSKLNDNNIRAAKRIVNATDAFLDGEASAEETQEIVSEEYDNIDQTQMQGDDWEACYELSTSTLDIDIAVLKMIAGEEYDVSDVIDARNNIAKLAGLSKYKGN